jgi:hypothetical protein
MWPKATNNPKGREKTSVRINISMDFNMPSLNFNSNTGKVTTSTPLPPAISGQKKGPSQ